MTAYDECSEEPWPRYVDGLLAYGALGVAAMAALFGTAEISGAESHVAPSWDARPVRPLPSAETVAVFAVSAAVGTGAALSASYGRRAAFDCAAARFELLQREAARQPPWPGPAPLAPAVLPAPGRSRALPPSTPAPPTLRPAQPSGPWQPAPPE